MPEGCGPPLGGRRSLTGGPVTADRFRRRHRSPCGLAAHALDPCIRCPDCAAEYLLASSCKGRRLCPSCGAKRAAEFAVFLQDEVVADSGDSQWVFTVPKLPRPCSMHHREMLGLLCTATWQSVRDLTTVAAGDGCALEALARQSPRNAVSLVRLRWVPRSETATYLPGMATTTRKPRTLDALDLVALLLVHVPDARRQLAHHTAPL